MTGPASDPTSLPKTPVGYRQAWAIVEATWAATVDDALRLPAGALTTRVDGQWSFLETLRHLIFATDSWVRRTILADPAPYHPMGVPHDEATTEDGIDVRSWGIDLDAAPTLDEVLAVRAERVADVRRVVGALTVDELSRVCDANPAPGNPEDTRRTVGRCLDVVVNEEWAHHGYAVRDLATFR